MRFGLTILFMAMATTIAGAQVVINEYCPSTSVMVDEDGDTSDWIELYNNSDSNVNLEGWHLSDRMDNLAKWTFPAVTIPAKTYMLVYVSGKDRYEYTAGKKTYMSPLIKWGDEFAYTVGASSIQNKWYSTGYDDSKWKRGKSGFGYGNANVATEVPQGTMSVFVRKKFSVSNLSDIVQLILDLDYDDGFVVYINGKEVARENLGKSGVDPAYDEATPEYVNPLLSNSQPTKRYILSDFTDYLVEGENVFAARIHNISETSSDLLLIPFLTACTTQPSGAQVDDVLNLKSANSGKYLHTNFGLSADGEIVYLSDSTGRIVHQTDRTAVPHNASRGLAGDGSGKWMFFTEPTPEAANSSKAFSTAKTANVRFEPSGGLYDSTIIVSMISDIGAPIYYTTDGTEPTTESAVYSEPIEVSSTTIFRAISYCDTLLPMMPVTQSYLFANHEITLPVFSLVTDPYNLYDENYGIYVEGPNAEEADPHFGANYHKDWERPMHVELFWPDGSTGICQNAGVKIAGAWSRAHPQKSFAFHARSAYGKNKFDCKLFNDKDITEFKSFLLRNSGNDWYNTMFRDALITGLVSKNNIDIQAYQPAVVFLNGKYWGILNIREKINEHYVANNYNWVDADEVDLLENGGSLVHGMTSHYDAVKSYLNSRSMSDADNYKYISTQIDIDEFIEYMVLELYCNNGDWPGNNCKLWHPQIEGGRWRWIAYDTDFGFGLYSDGYNDDNLRSCMNNNSGPAFVFNKLLKNSTFKRDLVNRFADRMNREFRPDVVNSLIDSLKNNITSEMLYHVNRWHPFGNWTNNINRMRTFAEQRPDYMRQFIRDDLSAGSNVSVAVDVNDVEGGYVQLNSLTIKEFPWRGIYFSNNPISIRAVARPGYKFVGWEERSDSVPELTLAVKRSSTFTAIFEKSDQKYNSIVINEINYKSESDQDTKDWVELFNTTAADIDISDWILTDATHQKEFVMPKRTVIPAYGYLVVCEGKGKFMSFWPELTNVVGNFNFGLKSQGSVLLYDADGNLVDDIDYGNKSPWPEQADGEGFTLSLANPFADNSFAWQWESPTMFGTPGALNDNYIGEPLKVDGEPDTEPESFVVCCPNPFVDKAEICWRQNVEAVVQVELFSAQGQVLARWRGHYADGEHSLDISNAVSWRSGLYYAKITIDSNKSMVVKILRR